MKNRIQYIIDKYFLRGTPVELASQNERLKAEVAQTEKFKSVATLASGLAHEVKNPLTAINTFTEYLPQKLDDREFLERFSRIVKKEATRINGLVEQLLDFARPAPLKKEPQNIRPIFSELKDLLQPKCVRSNIDLRLKFEPDPTLLTLDSKQIKQAALNILLNAIDALPMGGTITVQGRRIKKIFREYYEITITDTGKGIPDEDIPRLFDPFFSRKEAGTGLGLAITKGIIEDHGGKIKVKSKKGEGTTFIIHFPIAPESPA